MSIDLEQKKVEILCAEAHRIAKRFPGSMMKINPLTDIEEDMSDRLDAYDLINWVLDVLFMRNGEEALDQNLNNPHLADLVDWYHKAQQWSMKYW